MQYLCRHSRYGSVKGSRGAEKPSSWAGTYLNRIVVTLTPLTVLGENRTIVQYGSFRAKNKN